MVLYVTPSPKNHNADTYAIVDFAKNRQAWVQGRQEGAILGVSAESSQISDAIRAGRRRESLSFLGGTRKIGC